MLFSNASLYPDARKAECVHLGSILFGKTDDTHWTFGWYPNVDGIVKALDSTDSEVLRAMLQELRAFFLRQLKAALNEVEQKTEEAVAQSFIGELPHNLRLTAPETWPPEKIEELTKITADSSRLVAV
ncbi:MAG: hypothetical protein JO083_03845 [Candidatus Eremiobacteraeota bacterium]|nr:hypothetical protein [Candidatus Eremiobacteraeota bacterium]MBV8367920.1 hypothetical protein [Candidatus Eremiobacteraeota bacterium]